MGRSFLFLILGSLFLAGPALGACKLDALDATQAGAKCDHAWFDTNLRLSDLQFVGTGASAKLRPSSAILGLVRMGGKKEVDAINFAEPPMAAQLDAGVRALSFDIAYDPKGGLYASPAGASMASELLDPAYVAAMKKPGFKVLHVIDIDYNAHCLALEECLGTVAAWSDAHPSHAPLFIFLRAADERTPMPGATHPTIFNAAAFDALDDTLRAAIPDASILTPDRMRGSHADPREAALAHAWPRLGQARGKIVFVLDSGNDKAALYAKGHDGLAGRAMFVAADDASPAAAFVSLDDPHKDASRIAEAVKAGLMVKTRADDETVEARTNDTARRDAAFASGAQIVVTDFAVADPKIGAYHVDPGPVRCNVTVAGGRCAGWAGRSIGPSIATR